MEKPGFKDMRLPRLLSAENWRRMWSKDWLLRFVSLILAIIFWYMVGGEDKIDKNVMIPVEIINLPRDLVISNQFKKQIQVTVNGPRSLILEMTRGEITRQVDLSDAAPGTKIISNEIDSISVPRGVTIERIQPSTIILSLDKLIQRNIPIQPVIVGDVPVDYQLGVVGTDPGEIAITGPRTVLEQIDTLMTRAINVEGLKESIQLQVPLDLSQAIVDLIGETSVTVRIRITMKTVEKTIENLPVAYEHQGVPFQVSPATVSVMAEVPLIFVKHKMDLKTLFDVKVIGKEGGLKGEVSVSPKKDVVDSVKVIQIEPSLVTLVKKEVPLENDKKK